ncbi:DUF1972 domain-containing protein [Pontibacter liquoris]|uniref:DUF1972 domain-containing protein n=1 Tax=Pontibacter liquoris TaxID=2905677 RepID=UPI001FA6C41D|nr:DUF1972 domain-containing protein [Pontibacter liquoris]
MRIAIVGTRGIPNTYGGFETLAEYLVTHLTKDIDITVYCSSVDQACKDKTYHGARLKYIPLTSHGAIGILYDSLALFDALPKYDKVLLLGFGGGFAMPFLQKYKSRLVVNIGGLDWKRDKWSVPAQKVIKTAEKLLLKYSGQIVSDNTGIQQYITQEYNRESELITYGGDQAVKQEVSEAYLKKYPFLASDYAFSVARIQSDNNIDMLLEAFSNQGAIPLVLVGNWQNSKYGKSLKASYQNRENLHLLEAIYYRPELDVLRSNCAVYIHGHSAGGTNPSLVEAMYLGLPVFAFASGYNEHTSENKAFYFSNAQELTSLLENYHSLDLSFVGNELKQIAEARYKWELIATKYKSILTSRSK